MNKQEAYLAGGCFWCITPTFDMTDGVLKVTSGYSGGAEQNPSYSEVKAQQTGHRETIRIEYDADRVGFDALLEIFLGGTDPFDPGGQFIDRGHSYTLAVYYRNEAEREIAAQRIRTLEEESGMPVYISLEPFTAFWEAEEYHQDYYRKNPEAFERELIESGRKKE